MRAWMVVGASTVMVAACSGGNLVNAIKAEGDTAIEDVIYTGDWLDGDTLDVYLVPSAGDAQAREVWCSVLRPLHLPGSLEVRVVTSSNLRLPEPALFGIWDPPADCDDPEDIPAMDIMVFD